MGELSVVCMQLFLTWPYAWPYVAIGRLSSVLKIPA